MSPPRPPRTAISRVTVHQTLMTNQTAPFLRLCRPLLLQNERYHQRNSTRGKRSAVFNLTAQHQYACVLIHYVIMTNHANVLQVTKSLVTLYSYTRVGYPVHCAHMVIQRHVIQHTLWFFSFLRLILSISCIKHVSFLSYNIPPVTAHCAFFCLVL